MSKWYRFSLSLAAKCQLGFALAVLLIIAAGLFIPYRWMDKLVEQGKLELAQTEVQRLLQRHFQGTGQHETSDQMPSLVKIDDSQFSLPVTRWIPLAGNKENILEDNFLHRGVKKFLKHKTRQDYFSFNPQKTKLHDLDESPFSDNMIDHLKTIMPVNPGRYLWAVRADDKKCFDCHAPRTSEKTTNNEISPLENSPAPQPPSANPPAFTEGELVGVISVVLPAGYTSTTLLFNRIFIIIGGLLSCICAVVTFYLITQRIILRPVRSLRDAADQVTVPTTDSKEADSQEQSSWLEALSIMEKIKTGDEFEQLAIAFHQMLSRLKLAHDRLRETNRALDMQLGELEARNITLYESNKLKSEFLANISHELRTPLNAIIGFAEILKEQSQHRDDPKSLRYVSNVLESGKLLLAIINDLLDLARIEAGKVQVRRQKVLFREIADALLSLTRTQIEEKQLKINLFIDNNVGIIETDPGKLQQILFNLLSNAIKFTPPKGQIDITARAINTLSQNAQAEPKTVSDSIEITFADTGPGIAAEDQEKIFEKFRQLDGSVTRKHAGVGLGLTIVKELVEILGGTITVGSQTPKGAVFTVVLPIKQNDNDEN